MSDDFFRTRMGHTFYESTMPSLVLELARLNDNIERLVALAARQKPEPVDPDLDDRSSMGHRDLGRDAMVAREDRR